MQTPPCRQLKLLTLLRLSTVLSGLVAPTAALAAAADPADAVGEATAPPETPAAAVAPAQDPVDAAEQAAAPLEGDLGEIIVTATRTSQSIQKVPISIQALSAEVMAGRQVKGLSDFATLLPSVSFAGIGPGRNELYFRGIVPAGGSYASVGYYLDEIPIPGINVPDIHVYDLERIEALSGPQGTLFGASSLAGTIRFITNKPKLGAFEAGYDLEANKFGPGGFGGQAQGYVNVPLGEAVAMRAMGYYRRDGGYIDNVPNNGTFNDGRPSVLTLGDNNPATSFTLNNAAIARDNYNSIDEYGGRLQFLWEPADGWAITPSVTAQRQISRGYFGFDQRLGDLEVRDFDTTRRDDKWYQAALTINGHIGDFDLVSATGYFRRQVKQLNDYTYYTVTYDGFGPGYENYLQFFDRSGCTGSGATLRCTTLINPTQVYIGLRNEQAFTQEVRLTTPTQWPFNVTFGGFYQSLNTEISNDYAIRGLGQIVGYTQSGGGDSNPAGFGIPVANGGTMVLGSPAVKRDAYYLFEQDPRFKDWALFAEGYYDITPTLKLTGGIRYFWTDYKVVGFGGVAGTARSTVTSLNVATGTLGCPVPLPEKRLQCLNSNIAARDQVGRYSESGQTYKVALDWSFAQSKMVYATYSTGFRPGGFNRPLRIRNFGLATVNPFGAETLTNYEIGLKTTWNNIFRFNAAAYFERWNNIQYSVIVSGAQGAGITGNAGNAEVRGVEYDAALKLGRVTISTAGAYNDARLKGNFCNFAFDPATAAITQLPSCTLGQVVPGSSPPTAQVAAADGTRLPRQPQFKGTTTVRYDTEIGEYRAYLQGAALYQTGATQSLNVRDNNLLGNTPGFVSFDFSAGIRKDNWTVDLFLNNAFDRRGQLTRNTFCTIAFCSQSSRTFIIRPQFFGIRVGQRF
jgi:iron complex outermembrane recepter protein